MTASGKKAKRIRELYATGRYTVKEIAAKVGCSDAYVRVVARQRVTGGLSKHDVAYRVKKFGSVKAYQADHNERTRDYRLAYYRERWKTDAAYRKRVMAWRRAGWERLKADPKRHAVYKAKRRQQDRQRRAAL